MNYVYNTATRCSIYAGGEYTVGEFAKKMGITAESIETHCKNNPTPTGWISMNFPKCICLWKTRPDGIGEQEAIVLFRFIHLGETFKDSKVLIIEIDRKM